MKKYFIIGLVISILAFGLIIGLGQTKAQDRITGDLTSLTELIKAITPENAEIAMKLVNAVFPGADEMLGGGTRWPNGISADDTSPLSGEVRGTTLTITGIATLPKVINTPTNVIASSTPAVTVSGTGIPIANGLINVQVLADGAAGAEGDIWAYVNLPELDGTINATGTEIYLHAPNTAYQLNTASTTGGILETINDGAAGALASSTIPAAVEYTYCRAENSLNWICEDNFSAANASSTNISR